MDYNPAMTNMTPEDIRKGLDVSSNKPHNVCHNTFRRNPSYAAACDWGMPEKCDKHLLC